MVRTKQILVVIHLCSFLVLLYSLSMIPPLLMGLLYKEKAPSHFSIPWWWPPRSADWAGSAPGSRVQLRTQDGFLIIVMFWLLFSAISALPLWLDDTLNVRLVDAMFEGSPASPPPAPRC